MLADATVRRVRSARRLTHLPEAPKVTPDDRLTESATSASGAPTLIRWAQQVSDLEWASRRRRRYRVAAAHSWRGRPPHASCSTGAAEPSDASSGRLRLTWFVDQPTFPPDEWPLFEVPACAGTGNGHERLGSSAEARMDVMEQI